jgi:hypothetical protein
VVFSLAGAAKSAGSGGGDDSAIQNDYEGRGQCRSLNSMLETTPGDLTRQRKNRGPAENLTAGRQDGQALIEFRQARPNRGENRRNRWIGRAYTHSI